MKRSDGRAIRVDMAFSRGRIPGVPHLSSGRCEKGETERVNRGEKARTTGFNPVVRRFPSLRERLLGRFNRNERADRSDPSIRRMPGDDHLIAAGSLAEVERNG